MYFISKHTEDEHFCFMSYQSNVIQTVRVQDSNLKKQLLSLYFCNVRVVRETRACFTFGAHIIHLFGRFCFSFGYLLLTVLVIS